MKSQLLAASSWLRRTIEWCAEEPSVPIEQRQTVRLKNIRIRQYRSKPPKSFYMNRGRKIVVFVYSDSFVEIYYEDIEEMKSEVQSLISQGIMQLDLKERVFKMIFLFSVVAIILMMIAIVGGRF